MADGLEAKHLRHHVSQNDSSLSPLGRVAIFILPHVVVKQNVSDFRPVNVMLVEPAAYFKSPEEFPYVRF